MNSLNPLEEMSRCGHERVCYHVDEDTGLRAIIAVHSTKLGNALGGVRRWHYTNDQDAVFDVLRLSEGMTWKAACAGLAMGGAKSVILLPESGSVGTRERAHAMGRFIDTFNGAYIGAEDVGVSPQFTDWMLEKTDHVMGGTGEGQGGDPSPHTAMGVVYGMQASLQRVGRDQFAGLTIALQGLGSVGTHLAQLLHERGAELIVADSDDAKVCHVVDTCNARAVSCDEILGVECDILAPCALGAIFDEKSIAALKTGIICGAANNVLRDPEVDAHRLADRNILYAPDFIVNAGGLIHLAGLYLGYTTAQLEAMIARIEETTMTVFEMTSKYKTPGHAALALAKQRIEEGTAKEQVNAR
ncbi:MAG: Glu/Leu/Phe/Val dehydrogenase dimerization domain-containing protein [Planctomycetota bacterium]|nr:Glu/Leu/Phe/Val dehydrogenase dimerization domain-containing protein [Planctomycetota bacterium]